MNNTVYPVALEESSNIGMSLVSVKSDEKMVTVGQNLKAKDKESGVGNNYKNTDIYFTLKPFLVSMKMWGLYFDSPENGEKRGAMNWFEWIYSSLVVGTMWLNVARCGTFFNSEDRFGPVLFQKVMTIGWMVTCALNATFMHMACHDQSSKFRQFCIDWSRDSRRLEELRQLPTQMKLRVKVVTVTLWVVVIFNILSVGFAVYLTSLFDLMITPASIDHPYANVFQGLNLIAHSYLTAAWIFPMGFYVIISNLIGRSLYRFTSHFENLAKHAESFKGDMEFERQTHQKLCSLVGKADEFLTAMTLSNIALHLLIMCLVLYNLIRYTLVRAYILTFVMHIFWLCSGLVFVSLICLSGGYINHYVCT